MPKTEISLLEGDCLRLLPTLPANHFHACITDPPYNLGFMGKQWDKDVAFKPETWAAVLRVLRPGAHLLAFGGTRTYHRIACAIEDAGFEIRDCLMWAYGQGFPKSVNIEKSIIRLGICQSPESVRLAVQNSRLSHLRSAEGREHIAVALAQILPGEDVVLLTQIGEEVALHAPTDMWPSTWVEDTGLSMMWSWNGCWEDALSEASKCITSMVSEMTIARATLNWLIGLHISGITMPCNVILKNGYMWPAITAKESSAEESKNKQDIQIVTALGNAMWNPVARSKGVYSSLKPAWEPIILARKPLAGTLADNALAWGCGGLNIDACRVEWGTEGIPEIGTPKWGGPHKKLSVVPGGEGQMVDRTPPSQSGRWPANLIHDGSDDVLDCFPNAPGQQANINSTASNSKFKNCHGKINREGEASKDRENLGEVGFKMRPGQRRLDSGNTARFFYCAKVSAAERGSSIHPTMKPLALMEYLIRLVCPANSLLLDPFAGSGSTGLAAATLGLSSVLIEADPGYCQQARNRLASAGLED